MSALNKSVVLVYLLNLVLYSLASQKKEICDTSVEQVEDGKWKNYDFVLDDCFVRKFLEAGGDDIDFRSLVKTLNELVERNIKAYQDKLDRLVSSKEYESKIKHELEMKAGKQQFNRLKRELRDVLATSSIQTSLVESQIRELMDTCLLPPSKGISYLKHEEMCSKAKDITLQATKSLCQKFRAKIALLLSDTLTIEEKNRA